MCHTDSELIGILVSLADDVNETTPAPDCSHTSTASSTVNAALNDFSPPQSDDANLGEWIWVNFFDLKIDYI